MKDHPGHDISVLSFNLIACKFLQVPSLRLMTIIQQQGFRYIFYLTWVNTIKIKVYAKKSQFFLEPFYPFSTIFPWIVKCLKCFIFNWIISTPTQYASLHLIYDRMFWICYEVILVKHVDSCVIKVNLEYVSGGVIIWNTS